MVLSQDPSDPPYVYIQPAFFRQSKCSDCVLESKGGSLFNYFIAGSIFESDVECLVNTVNCGGHGEGHCLSIKLHYPENNKELCMQRWRVIYRSIHLYREKDCEKLIVNFPTKNKWREKLQISYIRTGLDLLVSFIKENIQSIAMPALDVVMVDWIE